ncbi:hypothetical protein [Streptomyces sp. NPDC057375]|uniref:hypothetical protein n=1 Tax=Streptomyces sp. NPDC057375 TaxID=3346109 RepID=UPI00363CF63B
MTAFALSLVLAVAALADQFSSHTLTGHARDVYASSGQLPTSGVLYGLVYTVAIVDALLWLLVLGVARSHRRPAGILSVITALISAAFAAALLASTEYGAQIFPPVWGALAILPVVAGILASVLLLRRDRSID